MLRGRPKCLKYVMELDDRQRLTKAAEELVAAFIYALIS
jgi:hypothetical protein